MLNDRPLTHISSNAHDEETLTQQPHLLYRRRITTLPHIRVEEYEILITLRMEILHENFKTLCS